MFDFTAIASQKEVQINSNSKRIFQQNLFFLTTEIRRC